MSSTDEQIQATTAPDTSKSEQSEPSSLAQKQSALLKALLDHTNPFCNEDERQLVLRALHHETGGSDEGLAMANEWLIKGDAHPGGTVLRDTWQAFADDPERPNALR